MVKMAEGVPRNIKVIDLANGPAVCYTTLLAGLETDMIGTDTFRPECLREIKLNYSSLKEIDYEVILPSITSLGRDDPYEQFYSGSTVGMAVGELSW